MRVIMAAGGTAGHIFPGLAVARSLRERFEAEVVFVGRAGGQEARLVPEEGFPMVAVESRPFVRRISPETLAAPLAALRAARTCRGLLRDADVAVGMGGYASVPVSLAALRERRPLVLHEQNAVPGLANRTAARWARALALTFGEARRRLPRRTRAVVTGNPVRKEILRVSRERETLAAAGRRDLGLEEGRRTIVLFGGSQGALHLNHVAVDAMRLLAGRADLQVLLITGPAHHAEIIRRLPSTDGLLVVAFPFVDRMEHAYAAADLVIARAGASTVAEVTVCGLPALLIPYPYATGRHQEANARALERAGGASVLLDDQIDGPALAERIDALLVPERLAAMAERSAAFGRPDAAAAVADLVAEVAG